MAFSFNNYLCELFVNVSSLLSCYQEEFEDTKKGNQNP
jgi:hypothetical protein